MVGEGKFNIDKEYIRNHFSHVLGSDVVLLDRPDGLDKIQSKVRSKLARF